MASIKVFTGPMGASKTTRLLHELNHYSTPSKQRVLLVCHGEDDRNPEGVSTHLYGDISLKIPLGKYVDVYKTKNLSDVPLSYKGTDGETKFYPIIGIDECQFFDNLVEFAKDNMLNPNLTLIFAGLSYDKENKEFGETSKLLPYATHFEKIPAVCSRCQFKNHLPAAYTYCYQKTDDQVLIGGLDLYEPRCAIHYFITE